MDEAKPLLNQKEFRVREKVNIKKRAQKPLKTKSEAYIWLIFGGLFFGCHRRYLGQHKQGNLLLVFNIFATVLAVTIIELKTMFFSTLPSTQIHFYYVLIIILMNLVYLRELLILSTLVAKTNKRIENYNVFWFGDTQRSTYKVQT